MGLIESMHPGVVVSKPYEGDKAKVAEIRKRLIKHNSDCAKKFREQQVAGVEFAKKKRVD